MLTEDDCGYVDVDGDDRYKSDRDVSSGMSMSVVFLMLMAKTPKKKKTRRTT